MTSAETMPAKRVTVKPSRKGSPPKGRRRIEELPESQQKVFATPSGFWRHYLHSHLPPEKQMQSLSPRQAEVMDSLIRHNTATTGVFCNEAGKTTRIIAGLILWHLTVFRRRGDNGGVITSSGSWPQIKQQLVPALMSFRPHFPTWDFNERDIKIDGIPNWMAFSVNEVGLAEGFHGSADNPLMALLDEDKSIDDGIFNTVRNRCRPQRLGLFSSPGYAIGHFYDSHFGPGNEFFNKFTVTVDDCPWVDRAMMQRIIMARGGGDYEMGLQDPEMRSAYFAEFMQFVENAIISSTEIEKCIAAPPTARPGENVMFFDWAAGGDECVAAFRNGNVLKLVDCWRDKNPMSSAGRALTILREHEDKFGLHAEDTYGDADGMGDPVNCRIREMGWEIQDFHANAAARDAGRFKNLSSEVWFKGTEAIKQCQVILPNDADLKGQLMDRQARFESSGKRWVESKKELFQRQSRAGRPVRSPDRADAILGAMIPSVGARTHNFYKQQRSVVPTRERPHTHWDEKPRHTDSMAIDEAVLDRLGANAG